LFEWDVSEDGWENVCFEGDVQEDVVLRGGVWDDVGEDVLSMRDDW
jgi:hypothetical protein